MVLIKDFFYVPAMKSNLMIVGQLIEKGFLVTMKNNLLKLYDYNQKLIMQYEQRSNITFKVNVEIDETKCLSAKGVGGDSELWHNILGASELQKLRVSEF